MRIANFEFFGFTRASLNFIMNCSMKNWCYENRKKKIVHPLTTLPQPRQFHIFILVFFYLRTLHLANKLSEVQTLLDRFIK